MIDLVSRLEALMASWNGATCFQFKPECAEQVRQLAAEIRREENEACAQLCDDEALEAWKAYKTGRGPGRANPRTDGMSDGAEILAGKIRARMEPKRLPTAAEVRGILKP